MNKKFWLIQLAFLVLSVNSFAKEPFRKTASQPNTYSCNGYILTISEDGTLTLTNEEANSSGLLGLAGPNSGSSTQTQFSGSLIPLDLNLLTNIHVAVDNALLEGGKIGFIAVSTALDGSTPARFRCKSEV